jgi:hypothetical protein
MTCQAGVSSIVVMTVADIVPVAAVGVARNGVSRKSAERSAGYNAPEAAVTDRTANYAAADRTDDRSGRVVVMAAGIGLCRCDRATGGKHSRDENSGHSISHFELRKRADWPAAIRLKTPQRSSSSGLDLRSISRSR